MTSRYIAQAIIAALCEHPDQAKYKDLAFSGDNLKTVMNAMSGKGEKLSKADFFTADDNGKFIIDTPGFWKNFDKVLEIVQQNGECFVAEDFYRPLNGKDDGRTLLDSAAQHDGLAALFSAATWTGRYDDMERLWFHVSSENRKALFKNDGYLSPDVKRQVMAAEGLSMPEDAFARAGLSSEDYFKNMATREGFVEVKQKMAAVGAPLSKIIILTPDREGNTIFSREGTWGHYNDIVQLLAKNGERFETSDFLRQNGNRLNILARAAENKMLHQVFTPEHWVDRLDGMLDVWSRVLPGWKKGMISSKDFDLYYAKAEQLTYSGLVNPAHVASRADLIVPLNPGAAAAVLPLGLKSIWDQMGVVLDNIAAAKGDVPTLQDLRSNSGGLGHSCLMSAAKFGSFDKVSKILKSSGEKIEVADFLTVDRHGISLLEILAERNELSRVFSPDLWMGRIGEMKTLWSHVRVSDRSQIDIYQVEVAVKQQTLKNQAKDKFKFPKGPF